MRSAPIGHGGSSGIKTRGVLKNGYSEVVGLDYFGVVKFRQGCQVHEDKLSRRDN